VIGVGTYPHLQGGQAQGTRTDGLGQLSSPPISARRMAEWLLGEYHCPSRPLASLALLTSEVRSAPFRDVRTGLGHRVARADIGRISTAVTEWYARGDTHPDNRMIFYFCGHGTAQGNDMALLARDFSLDAPNPLNGALDLPKLVSGLSRCQAEEQLFFVDACRSGSDLLISQFGDGTFAGVAPLLPGGLPRQDAMTYYSTLAGAEAYARPGAESLFTAALLKALRGAAGDRSADDDPWRVGTIRLHEAIGHFLQQPTFAGAVSRVQRPTINGSAQFTVHELPGPPLVPVYVGCRPPDSNGTAKFTCRQPGRTPQRRRAADLDPQDPTRPWVVELALGTYEFEARVGAGDVRRRTGEVRPISTRIDLVRTP
jgi:hypothetical protein